MLAFIALTGGISTIFVYLADIKTKNEFIFRISAFTIGFIVDIILFFLIRETNIDIQAILKQQESDNNG